MSSCQCFYRIFTALVHPLLARRARVTRVAEALTMRVSLQRRVSQAGTMT